MSARRFCLLIALALAFPTTTKSLDLASVDISWSTCSSGFYDPAFPQVCGQDRFNPLHVAVTISSVWWNMYLKASEGRTELQSQGPGRFLPQNQSVFLHSTFDAFQQEIGWRHADGQLQLVSYEYMGQQLGDGYNFHVDHVQQDAAGLLHHVASHFTFDFMAPSSGDYELVFQGCCRWPELANIPRLLFPQQVPWQVRAKATLSSVSAVPVTSPRASVPITQMLLRAGGLRAFDLRSKSGSALKSVLNDADISGKYVELPMQLHLDSSIMVRKTGSYSAFVREDGLFSILWLDSSSDRFLLPYNGAWATGSCWVIARGNVSNFIDRMPSPEQNFPHVEGIGGVWDSSYGDWKYTGPFWSSQAVSMAHSGTVCHLQYENVIQVDASIPYNTFAADLTFQLSDASSMGSMYPYQQFAEFPLSQVSGLYLDPALGVLYVPPSALDYCKNARVVEEGKLAPSFQLPLSWLPPCAIAVAVEVRSSMGSAPVELFVELVQDEGYVSPQLDMLVGSSAAWNLHSNPRNPYTSNCVNSVGVNFRVKLPAAPSPPFSSLPVKYDIYLTAWRPGSAVNLLDPTVTSDQQLDNGNGNAVLQVTPTCSKVLDQELVMLCAQVFVSVNSTDCRLEGLTAGRCLATSLPMSCVYLSILNSTAVVHPLTAQAPPPPPPPPAVVTKAVELKDFDPKAPAPFDYIHVLDVAGLAQLNQRVKGGFVYLQFTQDVESLDFGVAKRQFNPAYSCLCAGARDLVLQRTLIDKWNQDQNALDSPYRGIHTDLSYKDMGKTVNYEGKNYQWTCVKPLEYSTPLVWNLQDAAQGKLFDCVLCWKDASQSLGC